MTKKDYQEAIATVLYEFQDTNRTVGPQSTWTPQSVTSEIAQRLADVMAVDNPRFNRALFIQACETGACKGMPRKAVA